MSIKIEKIKSFKNYKKNTRKNQIPNIRKENIFQGQREIENTDFLTCKKGREGNQGLCERQANLAH